MQTTSPQLVRRRTFRARSLLLTVALLGAACSDETPDYGAVQSAAKSTPIDGYALAEHHAQAERWAEVSTIHPALYRDRAHLGPGWSYPGTASDEEADASSEIWTDAFESEVYFHLREPADRSMSLRVAAFAAEGQEEQVEIEVNGSSLGEWMLGRAGRRLVLDLPA